MHSHKNSKPTHFMAYSTAFVRDSEHCMFQRFTFFSLILLAGYWTSSHASVEQHFQHLRSHPHELYDFLKAMPKGGELHYHFDGSVYAETMINLSTQDDVCLDAVSMASQPCQSGSLTMKDVQKEPALFARTIRAWSMQDFIPRQESAYEHFHTIFPKLFTIQSKLRAPLLAAILQRAAEQHELYLELMAFGLPNDDHFAALIHDAHTYDKKRAILLADKAFQAQVKQMASASQTLLADAHSALHCATDPKQAACHITIRFQCYVRRVKSIDGVFAQALAGFLAAQQSKTIVGINLVDVEDNRIAQQDYEQHMLIFGYLHGLYPKTHIALHAGELFPKAQVPHRVISPIRDAILIGHAERIGHGLDILEEPHPDDLAAYMAKQAIAVEVNLTSNRLLFGISGSRHPLRYYLQHQVPVVLSTDDEGILRTELSNEYVDAVTHHHLDYATLKHINRNTLTYGFMPGQSLWQNAAKAIVVPACNNLNSLNCKQFIRKNPKAKLQWDLEQALKAFEKRF